MARGVRIAASVFAMAVLTARGGAQLQPQVDAALYRLERTTMFAVGPVGFGGATSQGEKDFRVILHQTDSRALELFEELYGRGNLQGRVYALLGIHRLDPARFQELAGPLSDSDEKVETMRGCVGSTVKLKEMVRDIDVGGPLVTKAW